MVLHPTRNGVAIASLTNTFLPANGFHDDWYVFGDDGTLDAAATDVRIAERNANARLIAAAPNLLAALRDMLTPWEGYSAEELQRRHSQGTIDGETLARVINARVAIAEATGAV